MTVKTLTASTLSAGQALRLALGHFYPPHFINGWLIGACYKLSDYFSAPLSMLSGQALRLALGHFSPPPFSINLWVSELRRTPRSLYPSASSNISSPHRTPGGGELHFT